MKSFHRIAVATAVVLLAIGQQQAPALTEAEKDAVQKEVKDQFSQLVAALNKIDAAAWSQFYSQDGFVSAIVSADFYGTRDAWVKTISGYFATRERQDIKPTAVRVTPLAPDLALMTCEDKGNMKLKSGQEMKVKHVYTMIWKKEQGGWKILHSHESWVDEQPK